jgi:aspartokinase
MQVLKFGGTSVANAENMNKVASIIRDSIKKRGDRRCCFSWWNH